MLWIRPSAIPAAMIAGLLLSLASLSETTFAQASQCDPNLQKADADPNGYRLRGDRCEGVYIKQVAGTTVVASLIEYVENFNPTAGQSLRVEWTAPGNSSVRLRAYSLRHRLFYQMDTQPPAGSSSYTWPTNLLASLNLTKGDLGIVAITSYAVGKTNRQIYLPVRVTQRGTATKSSSYQLLLVPSAELDKIFVSLAPVAQDGRPGASIKDWTLEDGYYAAGRPVTITTPQVKGPGFYYLKISATFKAGGSATKEVWFYQP